MAKKLSQYNQFMKKELKGKMKGKTKTQRRAVFKAAVNKWNRSKGSKKRTTRTIKRSISRPRKRNNPTRNKSSGKSRVKSFLNWNKLKSLIQKGALILPGLGKVMEQRSTPESIPASLGMIYTGFNYQDGSFRWERLIQGYGPYLMSIVTTEGISFVKRLIKGLA